MLIKTLFALIIVIAVFLLAGITGWLFKAWPTSWPDQHIALTPDKLEKLRQLQSKKKFLPDPSNHYPGTPNEDLRRTLDDIVNILIDQIISGLEVQPRKSFVLRIFKNALSRSCKLDSEEKDQLIHHLSEIQAALDIGSSNELFNVWRYGLPYGLLTPSQR